MDLPASTIDSSKQARFDEKKAYVPQEEQGKAFV